MKRKAIGVLIFCIALLGAIVAGYWDLLNSERLRIARERMENIAAGPSGTVQAERPAQEPAAVKDEDSQGASSAAAGDEPDEGEVAEVADAAEAMLPAQGVAETEEIADEAGDTRAVDPPARSGIPTTIEPVVAANREAAAERQERQAAAVPSDTDSAEPVAPEDAAASPDDGAADGDPGTKPPAAMADSPEADGEATPGEAGGETVVADAGDAEGAASGAPGGDAGAIDPSSVTASEEALTPPRFDILRVETDGSTVIAGRAPAQSNVALVSGGGSIATETASAGGEFVIVLDTPLAPGDYQMRIEASLPDGRRVVSEETAIVSVPESGSESELLAMVEAPNAASRLISVPLASSEAQAGSQAVDVASAESLPADTPGDPANTEVEDELLLPQTAGEEASVEDAEMVLELPERVSTFFSKARALSMDAGSLDGGGAPPATVAIAEDAASVAEEGRALAEELPLAAETGESESAERLVELVRETAETAGEVGETAAAVDLARTAEVADRLADLTEEAEIRFSSLGEDRMVPSGPAEVDANAPEAGGAAEALAVEAVEIENDMIYIAGRAEPGSTVRVYLDNEYLADDRVAAGNRFLIATNASVARGDHLVRADQIDADGRVTARAEVPFFKPEGAMMSAIAPAPAAPEGSDGVEMLPATESGAEPDAEAEDRRADAATDGGPAGDTADDVAAANEAPAAAGTKETGPVAEAAVPESEETGRSIGAGQGSPPVASDDSGDDTAPTGEAAPSVPDEDASAAPDDAGPADQGDPLPPSFPDADTGDTDIATASAEGDGPDDLPPGEAATPPDGSAAFEAPSAGAPTGLAAPGGAGDDLPMAAIVSDEVSGPAADGDAEEVGIREAESAEIRPVDPPAGSAQDLAPGTAPETGTGAPASGSDIAAAAADPDPAAEASPPAGERSSAPGDRVSSAETAAAEASGPAGPAKDAGIAVNRQPALEPADSRVIIRKGDTLWAISRETYGRGSRYTVIYLANGDQIRDPDRIYPGQVFRLPDDLMDALDSSDRAN